jgi:Zn-dependent peptidase ImmA (M78 family)/DNA-binding XRE family transcriptional regulator
MQRSEFIRTWREFLHLSPKDIAANAGISEEKLVAIESGDSAGVDELESIARVLGLRGEQLYDDDIPHSAGSEVLRVLFKSAEGLQPPPVSTLAMLEAARAALDLLELHEALRVPKPEVPSLAQLKRVPDEPLHKLGKRQAVAVRNQLDLGRKPIESMRDLLVLRLRIPVLAANLGVHGPDAFSVFAPGRRIAIVLNVDGKHENLLVRRFTLAHELGHVCNDRPTQGGKGMACLTDSQHQIEVETRANAFAIHLMLPADVEKRKSELLEPIEFRRAMEQWGIHYSALRLYLKNLLGFSEERMVRECPRVDTNAPLHIRDAEELEAERSPLKTVPLPRRGELSRLVLQEHAAGRMSKGRTRELLRLDASTELDVLVRSAGLA